MFYEITYAGDRMIVESLEGYDGCEIVAEHDQQPPDDVAAMLSPEHVAQMHALKSLEASILLGGGKLSHSVLVDEADALGIDVLDLARSVVERVKEQRSLEVTRRVRKVASRQTGGGEREQSVPSAQESKRKKKG